MDEVWKDISLSSLPHSTTTTTSTAGASTTHHPFNNMALQDFFPSPLREDQPTRVHNSRGHRASSSGCGAFDSFSSQAPPPATILSLNSVPEFHNYLERDHAFLETSASVSSLNSSIAALTSSTVAVPSSRKKRAPVIGDDTGDRRHKRMIKNRESASRSRARKQVPHPPPSPPFSLSASKHKVYKLETTFLKLGC
ncbi:unnamed protein product [Ilex paraguariensis]|uniref:BZIP domain-containing protein n=1 Tax=Ilex paraguariensis TaxID=185542 RepID=A0ABC8UBL6_9AQUA